MIYLTYAAYYIILFAWLYFARNVPEEHTGHFKESMSKGMFCLWILWGLIPFGNLALLLTILAVYCVVYCQRTNRFKKFTNIFGKSIYKDVQ